MNPDNFRSHITKSIEYAREVYNNPSMFVLVTEDGAKLLKQHMNAPPTTRTNSLVLDGVSVMGADDIPVMYVLAVYAHDGLTNTGKMDVIHEKSEQDEFDTLVAPPDFADYVQNRLHRNDTPESVFGLQTFVVDDIDRPLVCRGSVLSSSQQVLPKI